MNTSLKANMKAEQDCLNACLAAIQKLIDYHWKPASGDSVAEANAEKAVCRVWEYLAKLINN